MNKINSDINNYFGLRFEYFIEKLLTERGIDLKYNLFYKWWHKDKEIDIVGINEESKEILFAECKWQDKVNAEKVIIELAGKTPYVEWFNDKRKEEFAIFAKSFSKRIISFNGKKVHCFDLKDIEKTIKKTH